jgi:LmbE family N-acetylglucosaminyl deacetylase
VTGPLTVLHLAPHPDDEAIGAPATLMRLRDAGHRVINLACSLGQRPDQRERRRAEAAEGCARAGFELLVLEPALLESPQRLADELRRLVAELGAGLVVGPTPHDGHPRHELVGRAARDALATPGAPRLWLWSLWADLPLPTLFAPFGEDELARATHVLRAHAGEIDRNDYAELLRCRAVGARVLGSERVFGFGAPGRPARYAELLTEAAFADGEWWAGAPREPDPADPLAPVPRDRPLGWWMREPSFRDRLAH